jgi:hypothetical protein
MIAKARDSSQRGRGNWGAITKQSLARVEENTISSFAAILLLYIHPVTIHRPPLPNGSPSLPFPLPLYIPISVPEFHHITLFYLINMIITTPTPP